MQYIFQLGIIIGVSFLGELVKAVLPFPIPASVYGMLIMLLLLCTGVIKPAQVEKTADYLLQIMPLFFLPPSVGLIASYSHLKGNVPALLLVLIVSTFLVMLVTGHVSQFVIRMGRRDKKEKKHENG